jgi:hypothetical protein
LRELMAVLLLHQYLALLDAPSPIGRHGIS